MKSHWNNAWHPDRATHQAITFSGGPRDGQQGTAARDCGAIYTLDEQGHYRRRVEGDYDCNVYDWTSE